MIPVIIKILKESDQEAGVPFDTLLKKIRSTPEGLNRDLDSLPKTVREELEKAAKQGLLQFTNDIAKLLPTSSESGLSFPDFSYIYVPDVPTTPSQPEVLPPDMQQEPAVDGTALRTSTSPDPAAIRRASTRVRTVPPRFVLVEETMVEGRRPGRQRRTTSGRANRHQQPPPASRSRSRSARRVRSVSRGRRNQN